MLRTIIHISIILFSLNTFSQTEIVKTFPVTQFDSVLHNKIYKIDIKTTQYVELIEFKNGRYLGYLINGAWKIHERNYTDGIVIQKIKIPDALVQNLMLNFKVKEIETIPECKQTKDCITTGFDGTYTSITISEKSNIRDYSYWEVESEFYYKPGNVPENIQKIRNILTYLDSAIHYKNQFRKFVDYLPKGSYSFGGVNMIKT